MINPTKYSLIMIGLLMSLQIQAQEEVLRKYATQETFNQIKWETENYMDELKYHEKMQQSVHYVPQDYWIKVVFHIVYADAESKIDGRQVQSQVAALNRDFSNRAARNQEFGEVLQKYASLAADTQIRFCLAQEAPNGQSSNGYVYYAFSNQRWTNDDAIKHTDTGIPAWDPSRYLNIWVAPLEDISGYAQMSGGPASTDGIVIDYRFFGTSGTATYPYDEGKTLTHLVGNYLNLKDLWSSVQYCADDGVADTPIHNSQNFTCPTYQQMSLCGDQAIEMTMNFMDNTPDACLYLFTQGQKKRMQMTLDKHGWRNGLAHLNDPYQ